MSANRFRINLVWVVVAFGAFVHRDCGAHPRFLFGQPVIAPGGLNADGEADTAVTLTEDGLTAVFGTWRPTEFAGSNLWITTRSTTTEPFGEPQILPTNSDFAEAGGQISWDGMELVFHSRRPLPDGTNLNDMNLWVAKRGALNEEFGEPEFISELSTPSADHYPSLSSDGLSMYFYSEAHGSRGGDIFVSKRSSRSASWEEPVNLGSDVNTASWEISPRISSDELSLFFVSDRGTNSRGSTDLFVSTRATKTDPWRPAVNLGDRINSAQKEESPPFLTADGYTFYFSRYASAENIDNDIWQVSVLPFESPGISGAGGVYRQNFDSLGTVAETTGTPLPTGWTTTPDDVIFQNTTTREFPGRSRSYAGTYNAGNSGESDRSLAIGRTRTEKGEIDFRTQIDDKPAQALRLTFDVEAWGTSTSGTVVPGETAFEVLLEADAGNGFQPLKSLGSVSTGTTLQPPAQQPGVVNGNDPPYRTSFDTGAMDVDVPVGTKLRFRWVQPEIAASTGWILGIDNVNLVLPDPGDANADGLFNSGDLVHVFQIGEYEDSIAGNSTWSDGDWKRDGEFDSSDLVAAFQAGKYDQFGAATSSIPEPSNWISVLFAALAVVRTRSKHSRRMLLRRT